MWHEARRQERKIRGMLVDYRRRAERRRDFYEKIKADPTQFLQIHGRQCKIHLDPAVAAAADSAVMMPWQGQNDNLIDRFDVRAHLDYIPPVKKTEEPELTQEERQLNYERYRIIAQNAFLGIPEEKFLKQLHLEEQFGYTETKMKKDPPRTGGAAIGFNYEDGTAISGPASFPESENDDNSDDNSDSDLDVDLAINVSKMDSAQAHEMNKHGQNFGMSSNDFYSFLTNDLEEAETYRLAKEEEHEKALFSGRKSRRERRAHREKRLANRVISPPSYAAKSSPTPKLRESKSPSRSPSPEVPEKIVYITSFGGEEEGPSSSSKPSYADKVKHGKPRTKIDIVSSTTSYGNRSRSRSRSRDRISRRKYRSRSHSRSYSRSKTRHASRSRKNRSRSRSFRRRSRSRSKDRYKKSRSRSRNRSSYHHRRYSRSSSRSSSSSSSSSSIITNNSMRKVSRSRSPIRKSTSPKKESPPKVLPRYYGRKKNEESSSELSESDAMEEDTKPNSVSNDLKTGYGNNNSGTAIKKSAVAISIQERLKRKRQALLNKQFKADKIAEQLKTEREKQEQQTREDELREMAIKLRRRQREKRHAYDSNRSSSLDSNSNKSGSSSSDHDKSRSPSPRRHRSRERRNSRDYKRDCSRDRSRDRKRRDYSRDHSRRGGRSRSRDRRSRDRRDRSRDKDRERSRRDRSSSPYGKERERNDRKDNRSRDQKDSRNKEDRYSRSLVDY